MGAVAEPRLDQQKSREAGLSGFYEGASRARALLSLQLENFVFNAELLALQIVDHVLVRQRPMVFLIEGPFQRGVLFSERLDAILHRHAVSSC
jgi:hypothetical protein